MQQLLQWVTNQNTAHLQKSVLKVQLTACLTEFKRITVNDLRHKMCCPSEDHNLRWPTRRRRTWPERFPWFPPPRLSPRRRPRCNARGLGRPPSWRSPCPCSCPPLPYLRQRTHRSSGFPIRTTFSTLCYYLLSVFPLPLSLALSLILWSPPTTSSYVRAQNNTSREWLWLMAQNQCGLVRNVSVKPLYFSSFSKREERRGKNKAGSLFGILFCSRCNLLDIPKGKGACDEGSWREI